MAIRFQCGACSQPIEVDEQWALRTVACPYCRKTITAPAESTLGDLSEVPTATPMTSSAGHPTLSAAPPWEHPVPDVRSNRIAIVALALALSTVVLTGGYLVVLGAHRSELETVIRPGMTFGEQVQASSEYIESWQGRIPGWMVALSVLPLMAGLAWIASFICGIVAVCRPHRRGLAIAALLIAGFVPVMLCGVGGFIFATPA